MSQSTPIDQIRRNAAPMDSPPSMDFGIGGGGNQSDSQLVEDILREMGGGPGQEQQGMINTQAYQYATDNAQVPAYKYMDPEPPTQAYSDRMVQQQGGPTTNILGINLNTGSIKDRIVNNVKYVGLVFVISFIISLPEFNRFIFGFFPRLLLESGQVSIGGVLLKAVIGAIMYALVAFFL